MRSLACKVKVGGRWRTSCLWTNPSPWPLTSRARSRKLFGLILRSVGRYGGGCSSASGQTWGTQERKA